MNRLIDAVALALAVGDTAQTGTRQQTNAARNDTGLVRDNITKQVAGDDDTVEGSGVLDHDHGRRVDELVLNLEVRELALKRLGHDVAPQAGRGEDVGLVEGDDPLVAAAAGEKSSQAGDALDLGARVGLLVPGVARAVVLLPLAKVDAARQLADNDKVGAAADVGLERRRLDQRVGREEARSQIAVGAHLLAQLQEALLRTHRARAPFRAADGTQQHCVGGLGGVEGLVRQRVAGGVDGALF